jgi:hypothetical protein
MNREAIEAEIRHVLATESRTTVLSNKLFQQGPGLFPKLASTDDERRELVKTSLFKEVQARVRELRYRDADALREASKVIAGKLPGVDFRLTLDTPPRAT